MCTNKQIVLCLGEELSIESSAPSWWQIKSMWIIFLLPLHILQISCNREQPNLQENPFFQLVAPFLCPLLHLFLLLTLPPQYPLFLLPTSNGYPWRWSPSSCPIFVWWAKDGKRTLVVRPVKRILSWGGGLQELAATSTCPLSQAVPMPWLVRQQEWPWPLFL